MRGYTRRTFALVTGGSLISLLGNGACRASGEPEAAVSIRSRPGRPRQPVRAGTQALGLGSSRDGFLHVPPSLAAPAPMLLLLHGAGNSGAGILRHFRALADAQGIVILAPDSRGGTWDAIREAFGPDPRFIDRALANAFDLVDVDPRRLAIGGFSDGATYALSLGLPNGELFQRIVAFSPGFVVGVEPHGSPTIFVSHGTADAVLPIDRCSRRIVADLKRRGYRLTYREFEGGHQIPDDVAAEGMRFVFDSL